MKLNERVYDIYKKPIKSYVKELKAINPELYLVWNKYLRKWTLRQKRGSYDRPAGHYYSEAKAVEDARIKTWFVNNFNFYYSELVDKNLKELEDMRLKKRFNDLTGDIEDEALYKAKIKEPKPFVKLGD